MGLTGNDVDVLIEALDAWEMKDLAGEIVGGLMVRLLSSQDDESNQRVGQIESDWKNKSEAERKIRKERSALLKAKLIGIRTKIAVMELTEQEKSR